MRFQKLLLLILLLAVASYRASAQTASAPTVEVGLDYVYVHANAPPAECGCFSLNGGGGNFVYNFAHGLGVVADLSVVHANQVNGTSQNITLFNALGGLRYTYWSSHRLAPYAQALVGLSSEYSNYAYVSSVSGVAVGVGGGMNLALTRHVAWNVIEADYLYSNLPNAVNNNQNDLRLSSGITFRFGSR